MNAGEMAEQVVCQIDRMLRKTVRKRHSVHDNGNLHEIDDTSKNRLQPNLPNVLSLQQYQLTSNVTQDNGPSNEISVEGLLLDREISPVQQMIAMIGALLAEKKALNMTVEIYQCQKSGREGETNTG